MKKFLLGLLSGLILSAVWYVAYVSTEECVTDLECEMMYGAE